MSGFNKTVCASLLIFSLLKFRRQAAAMDLQDYFGSEKLMALHLIVFVLYIVSYFAACIFYTLQLGATDQMAYEQMCRRVSSYYISVAVMGYSSIALELLFVYLSVKFSAPLDDYRKQFLLIFQASNLTHVDSATQEFKRAKRYNKAAMDHQKLIIW